MKTKKNLLLIEDDAKYHSNVRKLLVKDGFFAVLSAYDGKQALSHIEKNKIDIIILDLVLPYIDGFGILNRLKENDEFKKIPIVVITNLDNPEKMYEAIKLGADGYYIKSDYDYSAIKGILVDYLTTKK